MKALIAKLLQAYRQAGLDNGDGLLPPASSEEIEHVSRELGVPVHPDLRAIWLASGGQRDLGAGVSGLLGRHRLLCPAEAIEEHRLIWDAEPNEVPLGTPPRLYNRPVPELVPFGSWDAYALCIHAVTGEVWEYLPSPGLLRHRPDIPAVLRELEEVVRAGAEADLRWETPEAESGA